MADSQKHVFISYAHADEDYITSLTQSLDNYGVTYWLDRHEISWGEDFVSRINHGLATCKYILVCLSRNTLGKPWPTAELSAAIAQQTASDGGGRVLPLILNSRDAVLQRHPLLAARSFREFSAGADALAREMANMANVEDLEDDSLRVKIRSVHTGMEVTLLVPRAGSVAYLRSRALAALGLPEEADAGAFERLRVRWVPVEAAADRAWTTLTRDEQRSLAALLGSETSQVKIYDERASLATLPVTNEMVFHLYAVEDVRFPPPVYYKVSLQELEAQMRRREKEEASRAREEEASFLADWEPSRVREALQTALAKIQRHTDFIQTHGRPSRIVACVSCRKFEGAVTRDWVNSSAYREPGCRPLCDHQVAEARCKDPRVKKEAGAWWYAPPPPHESDRGAPYCPYFQSWLRASHGEA